MNAGKLKRQFDWVDLQISQWMARHGIIILRIALGIVFIWFGALKLFPGMSPAEDLVRATVPFLPANLFLPFLAVWEIVIGLGFLSGKALRLTILMLFLQMPGTLAPVVLLPERVFTAFPFVLTLEGQYIVKNMVLIAAALVIGATVRGGRLIIDAGNPPAPPKQRTSGVLLPILLLVGSLIVGPLGEPAAWAADTEAVEAERFFENRVRPILIEHCGHCHGSEQQFGGLRLDSWQSISELSDSAPVVIPGDLENSLLLQAIRHENGLEMPPDQPLNSAQIEVLVQWVKIGAPWPNAEPVADDLLTHGAREHWAFQPIVEPQLPPVQQTAWPRTPIDAFVLAELESRQLAPSPQADRRTLIRRASYLLTGLPPTYQRICEFVESTDPKAYETLIDDLLASPDYGQQWARHWLDVARYSDSKGYVYGREERFWTHAWAYRDWVVDALNQDRPYDEFLLMQLAADQVAPSRDDLAAMGFLTLGRRFLGVKHDIIDDRIDVVCRGMMGLTVGCARCHDHKYDLIPTKDYYSLYGVFDSCAEAEQSLSQASELDDAYVRELQKRQQTLADRLAAVRLESAERVRDRVGDYLSAQFEREKYPSETFGQLFQKTDLIPSIVRRWEVYLQQAERRQDPIFIAWHRLTPLVGLSDAEFAQQARTVCEQLQTEGPGIVHPLVAAAFREPPGSVRQVPIVYATLLADIRRQVEAQLGETPPTALRQNELADPAAEAIRQVLYGPDSPCEIPNESIVDIEMFLDISSCEQLWKLQGEVDRWVIQGNVQDRRARTLVDRPLPMEPRVFRRGNPLRQEAQVPRHFLTLLSDGQPQPFTHGSGRLELANKIVDPANPLTARVLVNRVWGHYFGRPLVETPSDFGLRASPPSHPELLDYLAARFVAEGWSLKELHRWILLSATFQQADSGPQDRQVAARAEEIDPGNRWLWRWQPQRLTFEAMRDSLMAVADELDRTIGGKPIDLWQPPFSKRRTLYGLVDRQFLPGLLRVFDFANPDLHISERVVSTAPQQALFFLNHPLVLEQTRGLTTALADIEEPSERILRLFRAVLLRDPDPAEMADALDFLTVTKTSPEVRSHVTAADWSYGYGAVAEDRGYTIGFTPLPYFDGQAWQGGPQFPDGQLGWVQLTAGGGHPGNDRSHAAVRRWTAPQNLEIRIQSKLTHQPPQGDGIRAFILRSQTNPGILAQTHAHQQTVQLSTQPLRVSSGETIDFLVDIGDILNSDQFDWHVTIVGSPVDDAAISGFAGPDQAGWLWDSAVDFAGHEVHQLNGWEQLAQILLCTNEFMFVP